MPDGVTPADPGLLASLADELALPGYAMRNMWLGRTGAAGRNLADFALNAVDAPLPGDWIPEISGAEDRPEFTDITGPIDDGLTGSLVNVAGNILTDPVTYIPGAQIAKAAGMAAKAAKAVTPKIVQEGVAKVAKPVGKFLRKTAGAERIGKPLAEVITKAQGAKEAAARASSDPLVEGLKGATSRELDAATEVLTNVTRDKATGAARLIDETETLSAQDRLARYLTTNPDVNPDVMARIVSTASTVGKGQRDSGLAGNIFTEGGNLSEDYFPRLMKKDETDDLINDMLAQPSAIAERKLKTGADLAKYLTAHPEIQLANAAESLGKRGAAQGELAARGAMGQGMFDLARAGEIALPDELLAKVPVAGKPGAPSITGLDDTQRKAAREWLLSKQYKQADPLMREAAEAIAKNLPGDEADVALHFLKGMKGRTGLPKALAALNSKFKPVAVYGAIVPKLGSITRNMTGGVWQKYSNPEARGVISPKNIPAFMRDWLASIEDGMERLIGKRVFTKNEFSEMDEAFKAGGGDPRKALALIKDPTMRAAAERGVFGNNFVDTEGLIAQAGKTGLRKMGESLYDYPGYMFKGAEQRMRYGLFKQLKAAGKTDDDAARIVRDSFYDYTQSSAENRLARDVIPFAQFMFKSIPQQAKLLAEKPALASTVANLYAQGRDEPVLPHMEGKVNIPIGMDEQGQRQYLTSLGLPFESLSALPNLSANPLQAGRDIEQNIVGATSPLLKMAYAYTSGRDPLFGSAPGSYTKVAGQDLGEAGGIMNQVLGTGLGPAVAAGQLAGKVGQFSDPRTNLGDLALNQLTGARIQSVDPDRAIQQRLQSALERDPSVAQFRTFYERGGGEDATVQEMLTALKTAKDRQKEKQKAMAPVN
jgi:hypothetical protein